MHTHIYQKLLFHLSLFGVAISILVGFYDVIFGSLWEAIHLILEIIEMSLDKLIEHVFKTGLQETQLIVFYIMLSTGGVLIYLAWKLLVQMFSSVSHNLDQEWSEFKNAVTTDWQAMSMTNRVIFISAFFLINYLASFLLF